MLVHLRDKPAAFRVIDTHAGAGRYDLAGPEASKTQEWRGGIGRLRRAELPAAGPRPARALSRCGCGLQSRRRRSPLYPGSPALAQTLLRPQDRLIACELEPQAAAALAPRSPATPAPRRSPSTAGPRSRPMCRRVERRGAGADRSAVRGAGRIRPPDEGLASAHRKWPTGIYLLWYPIKDEAEVAAFARRLTRLGIAKMLRLELMPANRRDRIRVCAAAD